MSDAAATDFGGAAAGRQQLGHRVGLGLAQRGGLRLAAAFGHRFGEIGEQHREPEPEIDLEGKAQIAAAGGQIAQKQDGGEGRHNFDHEHHRIVDQDARIELAERPADRRDQNLGIGDRGDRAAVAGFGDIHGNASFGA